MTLNPYFDALAVAPFPEGGVAINLTTGAYFKTDEKTARALAAIIAGTSLESAEATVAATLGLGQVQSRMWLSALDEAISQSAPRREPPGTYRFARDASGYCLRVGARLVLNVDGRGEGLRLPEGDAPSRDKVEMYLRALAPKILFLRGITLLHAAACRNRGDLIAFCGQSGAGKTSTARAFAAQGCELLAEDLLLVEPDTGVAMTGVERFVHAWARDTSSELTSRGGVRADGLDGISTVGSRDHLHTLWVMDASRRFGTDFEARRLDAPAATIRLMEGSFLGSLEPDDCRRHLAMAATLGRRAAVFDASAPLGAELLSAAAARYIST